MKGVYNMAKKTSETPSTRKLYDEYTKQLDALNATSPADYVSILGRVFHERSNLGLGYTGLLLIRIEEEVKQLLRKE